MQSNYLPHGKSQAQIVAENLTRIQIERHLSLDRLLEVTGLNWRTIQGIRKGTKRTRPQTIAKLAVALDVPVSELIDEKLSDEELFDRRTNPAAAEFVDANRKLFKGWTREEYAEFFSRFGHGGAMTAEGARASAKFINERREVLRNVAFLLETPSGEMLRTIVSQMVQRERVTE